MAAEEKETSGSTDQKQLDVRNEDTKSSGRRTSSQLSPTAPSFVPSDDLLSSSRSLGGGSEGGKVNSDLPAEQDVMALSSGNTTHSSATSPKSHDSTNATSQETPSSKSSLDVRHVDRHRQPSASAALPPTRSKYTIIKGTSLSGPPETSPTKANQLNARKDPVSPRRRPDWPSAATHRPSRTRQTSRKAIEVQIKLTLIRCLISLTREEGPECANVADSATVAFNLAQATGNSSLAGKAAFYVALAYYSTSGPKQAASWFEHAQKAKGVCSEGDLAKAWYEHCLKRISSTQIGDQWNSGFWSSISSIVNSVLGAGIGRTKNREHPGNGIPSDFESMHSGSTLSGAPKDLSESLRNLNPWFVPEKEGGYFTTSPEQYADDTAEDEETDIPHNVFGGFRDLGIRMPENEQARPLSNSISRIANSSFTTSGESYPPPEADIGQRRRSFFGRNRRPADLKTTDLAIAAEEGRSPYKDTFDSSPSKRLSPLRAEGDET